VVAERLEGPRFELQLVLGIREDYLGRWRALVRADGASSRTGFGSVR